MPKQHTMIAALTSLCLFALSAPAHAQQNAWQKFVSRDQKFSFQYPAGWSVEESASTVTIAQASTGEELLVIALPFDRGKSPAELATPIFAALRGPMPDLQFSATKADASTASFDLAYSRESRRFSGAVFVVKGADQAMWFSYSAPASGYDRSRGVGFLRTLVSTLSSGPGSQPPAASPSALPASQLIGDWSTSRSYGDVVNPVTGAYQRGSFSGELFSFRPDGGFRHVVMGSGVVISGVSIEDGQYTTDGNQLTLHVTVASWQPDPSHPGQRPAYKNQPRHQTQTYTLRFHDGQTLGLVAPGSKLETVLYRRAR